MIQPKDITAAEIKEAVAILAKDQMLRAAAAANANPLAEYQKIVAENNAVLDGFVFQAVEANDAEYQELAERVDDQVTMGELLVMLLAQANKVAGPVIAAMTGVTWTP